jgi:hypothetical protein
VRSRSYDATVTQNGAQFVVQIDRGTSVSTERATCATALGCGGNVSGSSISSLSIDIDENLNTYCETDSLGGGNAMIQQAYSTFLHGSASIANDRISGLVSGDIKMGFDGNACDVTFKCSAADHAVSLVRK